MNTKSKLFKKEREKPDHLWLDSWVCVYPCYIDADKSVLEGRKIAKEKAVKNPHAYHMAVACQKLGFSVVYEVCSYKRKKKRAQLMLVH